MLFQNRQIPAFGLDIGDQTLKLVGIAPQGGKLTIQNYNTVELPEGSFASGKITNEKVILEKIESLITKAKGPKLKTRFIHSCLPDTQTFIKLITIPEMTDKEIPEAVRWASEHHIPLPPDSIYIDWQVVKHDTQSKQIHVLIGAAPKELSDTYTHILKKASLIPLSLEIEATATARALLSESHTHKDAPATALIDIGATRTGLVVIEQQAIQFNSNLPFAGSEITKEISDKLSLSLEQAEQAKRVCGFDNDECEGALRTILTSRLDELVDKLEAAFSFYEKNFEHASPVQKIILSGGGAHFGGIEAILQEKLGITTTIGNPLLHCATPKVFPHEKVLSYTTAIGLALKVYE